ncbi:MAG TPA: glycosyltransferase family 2 protein, partial [Longimicrobium sp.]|nr:glycosyltransferase family 2 protein [Longimicrobium sp.]
MSPAPENPPLVSVVMPCYNAEPFVAEAIRSVLTQTYPRMEILVVDDASTDGSWEVVLGLVAEFPDRVRALRMERNRGGCNARNRGAETVAGDYLIFLDADDGLAPDTVAALVDLLRANPESVGACPWCHLERVDGEWVQTPAS